jgi:hypothetical protein
METRFTARRRMAIVLALCLSAFLISVDVTIVNVALPTLVRSLGATTTQLQWVVDAYSLVFAALVLAAGSLSDRQGRKGMLLAGLGVFAAGSLAGALAGTTSELIAARAVTSAPATEAIMGAVPRAQGRRGLGGQRRHPPVRRDPRRGGNRQRRRVSLLEPARLYRPGPSAGAGRIRGESIGRCGDRRVTRPCPSRPHPCRTRPGEQRERRLHA